MTALRHCTVCHRSDFIDLLDQYSTRRFRHLPIWKERCNWFIAHPNGTLKEAKEARLPGVSWERELEDLA